MRIDEADSFCPSNKQEWRAWLKNNHKKEEAVWLIFFKKGSKTPNLDWSEAVDEALCFGWIDSVKRSIDDDRYKQYFSKRKPNSIWSRINKEKIDQLMAKGLMAEAGLKTIEIAKQNGSWTILDSVEALEIPEDLDNALAINETAKDHFLQFSKSTQKSLLYWVVSAKRPETRQKRIAEIVESASNNLKPKQFRV